MSQWTSSWVNPAGRVVTAARVQGGGVQNPSVVASSAYTYDDVGRTTSVVRSGPGGSEANYSYTTAGRLSGASWSTGVSVAYSYNSVGELTVVAPSGTGSVPTVGYEYDPSGRVRSVVRQGQTSAVRTDAEYDGAGQLTSLVHFTDASDLEVYDITRDSRGNPTQVDTTTGGVTASALYTYDAVSRLKSECYPATGGVCTAKAPKTSFTYDKVGNRTTQSVRTVTGNKATTVATDYAYDAADELLTQSVGSVATVTNTWSANGALATSTTPAGTQTYTTDLTDELISLTLEDDTTVGYTQDAQGNRTSRTVDGVLDATWAWDDLSSLPMRIGEYDASGTLSTAWLADPTSSTGASLAQTADGVSSWLLSDPFANTVATVSTTGSTVSGTRTMDAFGVERTSATGSLTDAAVGFAGQYLDDATGLYDMRARDYDPTSGRFTATDPIKVPTGMPDVAGYSYAFNNPLMLTDTSGLWPDWGEFWDTLCWWGQDEEEGSSTSSPSPSPAPSAAPKGTDLGHGIVVNPYVQQSIVDVLLLPQPERDWPRIRDYVHEVNAEYEILSAYAGNDYKLKKEINWHAEMMETVLSDYDDLQHAVDLYRVHYELWTHLDAVRGQTDFLALCTAGGFVYCKTITEPPSIAHINHELGD